MLICTYCYFWTNKNAPSRSIWWMLVRLIDKWMNSEWKNEMITETTSSMEKLWNSMQMSKKHILWMVLHCHIVDLWSILKHFLVLKQKIKQRKLLIVVITCYVSYFQIILIYFISICVCVCMPEYICLCLFLKHASARFG